MRPECQRYALPAWEVMRYVTGFPKRERDSRLMGMLQICCDESGTEGQDAVVVMAGFVTTTEKWTCFSDEWDQMLTPHCPVFKMRKESKRKPIAKRNERLAAFAEIIKRNVLFKIECSVSVPAFRKVVKGKFSPGNHRGSVVDDYYFWIFQNLIARLCEGIWHRGYRHQFDLFFDEQLKYGPRAAKLYKIVQDVARPRYRRMLPDAPIFRKDDEFLPLQAADMFAWLVRKYYNRDVADWQWLLDELKSVETMVSPFLDEKRLTELMYGPGYDFDEKTIKRWTRILESG
jgi:hypothetical protein